MTSELTRWQNRYRHPAFWLATWFGIGLARPGPGTAGSLAALPIAYGLVWLGGPLLLLLATVAVFAAGLWAASNFSRHTASTDASQIVIDEVAGQWLTLLPFIYGLSAPADKAILYGSAFLAFRFFDIAKPWPIRAIEHRVKGGLGVMIDDTMAALYAIVIMFGIFNFL